MNIMGIPKLHFEDVDEEMQFIERWENLTCDYTPTEKDIEWGKNIVDILSNENIIPYVTADLMLNVVFSKLLEMKNSTDDGLSDRLRVIIDDFVIKEFMYEFKNKRTYDRLSYTLKTIIENLEIKRRDRIMNSEEEKRKWVIAMGVNMPETKGEGNTFENGLSFCDENKTSEDKLKPLPESNGEWNKYINEYIVPTNNKPKAFTRPSKDEYYLKIAEAVSMRGTCLRRKFGSIIVKDDTIISTGYVGAPRDRQNCSDRGICFRMENNIPSGTRYEACRSMHSEMNAIINADPIRRKDAKLYLVGIENDGSYTESDCCSMCKRMIINSGISEVIFRTASGGIRKVDVKSWVYNDDSLTLHEGY